MLPFKTILVPVEDPASGRVPRETALLFGRSVASHVEVVHVRPDATTAVPLVGEGMSGVMVEEMIAAAERQAEERAVAARAMFDAACAAAGVPLAAAPPTSGVTARWREETGHEEDVVARRARVSDLMVFGRPQPDQDLPSLTTLNAALMESGRPVLLASPAVPARIGGVVAIAWNGSAESARAVYFALPILAGATRIRVVTAREAGDEEAVTEELRAYLAWHGLDAAAQTIEHGSGATGEALLRECAAMEADLLVMGAYTHSRLRQLILGGVTRHVLTHATIPVLLSH